MTYWLNEYKKIVNKNKIATKKILWICIILIIGNVKWITK